MTKWKVQILVYIVVLHNEANNSPQKRFFTGRLPPTVERFTLNCCDGLMLLHSCSNSTWKITWQSNLIRQQQKKKTDFFLCSYSATLLSVSRTRGCIFDQIIIAAAHSPSALMSLLSLLPIYENNISACESTVKNNLDLPNKSANGSLPPKNSLKTSSGLRNVKLPPPKWSKWPPVNN